MLQKDHQVFRVFQLHLTENSITFLNNSSTTMMQGGQNRSPLFIWLHVFFIFELQFERAAVTNKL